MNQRNDTPTRTHLLFGLCAGLILGAASLGCSSSTCPTNDSPDASTTNTDANPDHQASDDGATPDDANTSVDSGSEASSPDASDSGSPDASSAANQKMCHDDCSCSMNKPKCEQQCLKELGGTGYLFQPIALDMFGWWQNNPSHCGDVWEWENARYSKSTQEAYDRVMNLDESEMQPCLDWTVGESNLTTKWKKHMYCFENYYIFNEPIRKEIRDCWAMPNEPEGSNCASRVSGNLFTDQPWFVRH